MIMILCSCGSNQLALIAFFGITIKALMPVEQLFFPVHHE